MFWGGYVANDALVTAVVDVEEQLKLDERASIPVPVRRGSLGPAVAGPGYCGFRSPEGVPHGEAGDCGVRTSLSPPHIPSSPIPQPVLGSTLLAQWTLWVRTIVTSHSHGVLTSQTQSRLHYSFPLRCQEQSWYVQSHSFERMRGHAVHSCHYWWGLGHWEHDCCRVRSERREGLHCVAQGETTQGGKPQWSSFLGRNG